MSLEAQYMTMIAMTVSGVVMGALYDMYRIILKEWRILRFFGSIADFLFWLISLALVFSALQWANHGDLRIYIFVILLIGYGLYRLLLQQFVVKSTMTIVKMIQWIVRMLYKLFLLLLIQPIIALYRFLRALLRGLSKIAFGVEGMILWPIRIVGKVLLWIFLPLFKYLRKLLWNPYQKLAGIYQYLSKWFQNKE